ncbi:glutamine hydrolyzing CTP synthase [Archaeoglobus profundus]|uniref:CTP synthase n=1 Tax=Archaeoglobus profundus (strain DSM 5631 / JCM 9629 / NBRC 100127 / Av18) TaxID=572546 RepID=D2RHR0_ARCPA|nr:CTP synthase (glutamine hydrolyzing) [Archaeoglobus profundus]ADB57835.1 CTP synthase [Archaeoglobus profundus DSM 5631]
MKYIFVTGGVMSGLGKGITCASIGRLLVDMGYRVVPIKIDPYINIDAGTMNPFQHGEVYVLKDGTEVDLDLGHYERFIGVELTSDHNITTGKIYRNVIEKERKGEYLGQTVQIIPHVTDEIKSWIRRVAEESGADVCLVEIGGTVGDIEGMPFLEAVRQMKNELKYEDFMLIHVTLVPLDTGGEQKTKPTQHSVKELRSLGLQPDAIVGRCVEKLKPETKRKISLFCDVPVEAVISNENVEDIYEVPLKFREEKFDEYIIKRLKLEKKPYKSEWEEIVKRLKSLKEEITIAIVGKYTHVRDSYISIVEALKHGGIVAGCKVKINWIESEDLEGKENVEIEGDGILVPGGFGRRGAEGKIRAIQYARENNIPFLGICFGFQLAVIEFARNVIGWEDANSGEFAKEGHLVIDLLPEQKKVKGLGGTMRLGEIEVTIVKGTLAYKLYGREKVYERHRHRYEVNPEYIEDLKRHGLVISGYSDGGRRVEIIEYPKNDFFIGTQFHPEFKSRPYNPAPIFVGFVKAALENKLKS